MNKKWVIIDFSFLAYRAKFALRGLEFEDFPTGIIYGFFQQFRTILENPLINSNKVLICCDSKKSRRRDVYPSYKRGRFYEELSEEEALIMEAMYDQMTLLRKRILPAMGVPVYRQTGLEADDLMADIAKQLTKRKEAAVIVTADGDLYQCITPYVHWFDPARKTYHTQDSFLFLRSIDPSYWGQVKAIAGCSSDNVKGIMGVGETTAVKFLTGQLAPKSKRYQDILNGQEIIERNKPLVILPHKKTRKVKIRPPKYNIDAFFEACETYGLASFIKKRNVWTLLFGGSRTRKRRA